MKITNVVYSAHLGCSMDLAGTVGMIQGHFQDLFGNIDLLVETV